MTAEPSESARPQDVGRRHRAKGAPSPETRSLLDDYRHQMRVELRRILSEIKGDFQGKPENVPDDKLLPLEQRAKRWDIAIRLAKELGAEVDVAPEAVIVELPKLGPSSTADFG